MLVMDKIPEKTMGGLLVVLIAGLGYIYSLQTSMLLITLIGFFLITFCLYVRLLRLGSLCSGNMAEPKRNFAVRSGECGWAYQWYRCALCGRGIA